MQRVTTDVLDLGPLIATTEADEAGALVVFAGTVRKHNDGHEVVSINYSVYEPLAERMLAEIEATALARYDIISCMVRHRVGDMEIGDTSVLVIVRSAHRGEAFEAGRWAIDTVKHEVPIWKREGYADGTMAYVKGCELHEHGSAPHHPKQDKALAE